LESDDVLPGRSLIALTLLAFVAWIVRRGLRAARRSPDERSTVDGSLLVLTAAAGVLASSYVLILLVSRLLADPAIPFDERLLSPLFLLAAILLAGMATAALRDGSKALRVLGALVFLSWWVAALRAVDDEVQYTLENGRDLTQSQWRESPLLGWARANAAHRPVYSNWASAVVLHLGRTAHELPPVDDAAILTAFTDTLRVRDGVALAFDWPGPRQIGVESLRKAAGLHIVARLADGSVFAAAP
jgi:hypothetical protein